jgi:hypothetical protein
VPAAPAPGGPTSTHGIVATGEPQRDVILSAAKDLPCSGRRSMKQYYVYIMTNRSRTLYIGVTGDLARRVYEHRHKLLPGFTSKYNITQLVYYSSFR